MNQVILENEFTAFVKARLEKEGISLRELARRIDMEPTLLSRYLTKKATAGPDQIERILGGLGIEAHFSFVEVKKELAASA